MKMLPPLSYLIRWSAWLRSFAFVGGLMLLASTMPVEGAAPEISIEQPAGTPLVKGKVVAWGDSSYGQTRVSIGLTGVQAIAAGEYHTAVVKGDSTVMAWGNNLYGQTNTPVGLAGVQAIAAGGYHTVALKNDGTVVAWGYNGHGQTDVPVGLMGVQAIAAGRYHTVALRNDGTVVAWGLNGDGQTNVPAGLSDVEAIASGDYHTVALKRDGTIAVWGWNIYGLTNVPVELTGVQTIAAGAMHNVVVKSNGTVVVWGNNGNGQTNVPAGLTGVQAVAAGRYHTVALRSNSTVIAWGYNYYGQTNVPSGLAGARAIASGAFHIVAMADSSVGFGNQLVGTTSAAKTFTIKNTGDAPLNITNVSVTGDNISDFTVNTAGILASLPADGQTTFTVTFTPGAPGLRSTTLRVLDNDTDEAVYDITLTGTGTIAPEISVFTGASTNAVDERANYTGMHTFSNTIVGNSSVAQTFTIKNTGNTNLTGLALTKFGANITDFKLGIIGTNMLAPDATTTFTVTFSPTAPGIRSAVVAIASNDGNENPFEIILSGSGFAPEITIEQPTGMPLVTGTVVAWDNQPVATTSAAKTFTIKNTGSSELNITNIGVTGGNSSDFTVTTLGILTTLPATTGVTTFTVNFTPGADGVRTTTLRVLNDDTDEGTFDIMLTGTGATAPEIAVFNGASTNNVDERTDNAGTNTFANTVVGSIAAQIFTIKNTGYANLTSLALTKIGTNPSDFSLGTLGTTTLAPDEATTFTVTFSPKAGGTRRAVVVIASNDGNENPFEINVTGTGLAPEIAIELSGGIPLETGTVVGWGDNSNGQTTMPSGLNGVQAIAAGGAQTVALKNDGTVISSGINPNVPTGLTDVRAIAAGIFHTVALKSDGTVVIWGSNGFGQANVPVGLTDVRAIAAGYYYTVAVKSDGTIVAWGDGLTNVPNGLTGVQAIAAGLLHTAALKLDGTVVAWGADNGGLTNIPAGLTGVQGLAAGQSHTVALKSNGTVVAWGQNYAGQTTVPTGLTGVQAIAAGGSHTMALKDDGTVVAWGFNNAGQTSVPSGLTGVRAIAAGEYHTLALTDSTVVFGNQYVGITSAAKTFTIKNIGTAPLSITSVSMIGGNASDFTISTAETLTSVPANTGATTFTVTFTPSAFGVRRTKLRVLNNDTDEGTFDIVLSGTGVASPTSPIINAQNLTLAGNGGFQFTFANSNNVTFSVLASTNLGLPAADWAVVGTATNIGGGLYQFAHPVSPDFPQRFYRLRFP